MQAYVVVIQYLNAILFGWINLAWLSVTETEAHLLVIVINIYTSIARAELKELSYDVEDDDDTESVRTKVSSRMDKYAEKFSEVKYAYYGILLYLSIVIIVPWLLGSVLGIFSFIIFIYLMFEMGGVEITFGAFFKEMMISVLITLLLIAFNYSFLNEKLMTMM